MSMSEKIENLILTKIFYLAIGFFIGMILQMFIEADIVATYIVTHCPK